MKRREMIREIAAGTVTLFFVPAVITSCVDNLPAPDNPNTTTIDLTSNQYKDLNTEGGFVVVSGIIIINTGNGFIALSSICTHQGCQVTYSHINNNLPCPCHGAIFSTSGSVIQGPATKPLKTYDVTQNGDNLTIS